MERPPIGNHALPKRFFEYVYGMTDFCIQLLGYAAFASRGVLSSSTAFLFLFVVVNCVLKGHCLFVLVSGYVC